MKIEQVTDLKVRSVGDSVLVLCDLSRVVRDEDDPQMECALCRVTETWRCQGGIRYDKPVDAVQVVGPNVDDKIYDDDCAPVFAGCGGYGPTWLWKIER
jgi:hypothetical protein